MNKQIERIRKTRLFLLDLVKDLSVEQMNEIPAGFNNNIIWNLAHLTAAQQGICYIRAGVPIVVDEKYVAPFRPGTKPEEAIDAKEINTIKELLMSTLEQLDMDYQNGVFNGYTTWMTRYNVELSNIDDAIEFLLFHEGFHSAYIMAMKRVISK